MAKKILIIFIPAVLIIASFYFSISTYMNYRENYVEIYVASHNISQRTLISAEDLEKMKVPRQIITTDFYVDEKDILGKYVKLSYSLPKGSFIYKGAIEENIRDLAHTLLKEGEVNYDIYTSEVKVNPGYLSVGMYIDLYLTIGNNYDKPVSGLLMENCRITGLYDNSGRQIMDYDNETRVNSISIAIDKDDVTYLNKALMVGSVSMIVNNNTYTNSVSSRLVEDSEVFMYLQ